MGFILIWTGVSIAKIVAQNGSQRERLGTSCRVQVNTGAANVYWEECWHAKDIWNSPRRGSLPLKCIPSHGLMPSQDMVQVLLPSHDFKRIIPSKTQVFDSLGILIIQTWIPSHGFKGIAPLKIRVFG
jgi:hypothetical protein